MPTFGSLFTGIGGLDLGLERAGWECRWQVELDDWCRAVLARHWPDVPRWADAKTFPPDAEQPTGWVEPRRREPRALEDGWDEFLGVDLIAGGFPCQPVSLAGRRRGQDDERWLWPEFARIVRVLRPRYVLVENVPGLLAGGMGDVLGDLAASGYDCEWDCIPAAAVGAPHLRYRVFVVAHAQYAGSSRTGGGAQPESALNGTVHAGSEDMADPEGQPGPLRTPTRERSGRPAGGSHRSRPDDDGQGWPDAEGGAGSEAPGRAIFGPDPARLRSDQWLVEPDVGRVAHGVPRRVDRLRGLGNAVVPQVAEYIGGRLMTTWKRDSVTEVDGG